MNYGINPQNELKRLMVNLPKKPFVGGFKAQTIIVDKADIETYKYLQYQHPEYARYIVIDIDSMAFDITSTNLMPNLLVINKYSDSTSEHAVLKGHAFYRLDGFVGASSKSRIKPQKTLRLINHSIINYLRAEGIDADPAFNGQKAKNPFNSNFTILSLRDEPWSFADFFEAIPEQHIYNRKPVIQQGKEVVEIAGRNCYLFEKVRIESYKAKSKYDNFNCFYDYVHDFTLKQNGMLSNPLDYGEIKQIVKSVSNWTWLNFTGETRNKGVMELAVKGHGLTQRDKEVLGANYTAKIKVENTYKAIQDAFLALVNENIKPTQKAVAERSGKSLRTVKTYWKQINR